MAVAGAGRTGVAAIVLLGLALLLLQESATARSCSSRDRVDHRNAECLYAWWKNRGLLRKSSYHVSNQCSEYGKIVANQGGPGLGQGPHDPPQRRPPEGRRPATGSGHFLLF